MSARSFQLWGFDLPKDPNRPVLLALSRAVAENEVAFRAKLAEASSIAAQLTARGERAEVVRMMDDALRCLRNVKELIDWIYPSTSTLSLEVGMRIANQMRDFGFPNEWVQKTVEEIGRKRVGRPATKRGIAIRAKEMRLQDAKRWTWPKIADALCECGKAHTIRCQDNLRREMLHLDKTMSKCGCKL